jgi:hypothetical protein
MRVERTDVSGASGRRGAARSEVRSARGIAGRGHARGCTPAPAESGVERGGAWRDVPHYTARFPSPPCPPQPACGPRRIALAFPAAMRGSARLTGGDRNGWVRAHVRCAATALYSRRHDTTVPARTEPRQTAGGSPPFGSRSLARRRRPSLLRFSRGAPRLRVRTVPSRTALGSPAQAPDSASRRTTRSISMRVSPLNGATRRQ